MKVQFIYTFEEAEQEIYDLENLTKDDIKYQPAFIDIATNLIDDEIKASKKYQEALKNIKKYNKVSL